MTIQHHPSDDSVLAYANGSLGHTLALALGAHVDGCEHCQATLCLAETLGGVYLDAEVPAEMDARALSSVLDRLDDPVTHKAASSHADFGLTLPASLQHQRIGGRRWLAPGIWVRPVLKDRVEGTRLYLMGAAPGKSLFHHGHTGIEMTQVLTGEVIDGGTRYGPGDFLEADSDVEHTLVVGADAECICVIASQGVPRGLPGLLMRLLA